MLSLEGTPQDAHESCVYTAGRKQSSPLVFALIVAVFGTAGALFLTNVEEVG
jgi:hypothetical protein